MNGIVLEIDSNLDRAVPRLQKALGRISLGTADPDIAAAFRQVNARVLGFNRRRFQTLSRSGGSDEWPDLALSTKIRRLSKTKTQRTKARRQAKKEGYRSVTELLRIRAATAKLPILVDTGLLRNSLSGGAMGIDELTPMGGRIGTAVKYARHHQEGGKIPGRPPRRRILVKPDKPTLAACVRYVSDGLGKAMARALASPDGTAGSASGSTPPNA